LIEFLFNHDGYVAAVQALLLVVALGAAWRPILAAWRDLGPRMQWTLTLLGLAGMLLPLLLFPTERYAPLGHEASYFECFTGQQTPSNSAGWHAFVTYPLLRWLYWAIGGLVGRDSGPGVLLLLNAAATGLGVTLFAWFARVISERDSVGTAAGVLLVVHPVHAFWGAAIYHTAIPYSLAAGCLVLSLLAWREGCARLLLAAAACGVTMAALRIEWGILAPALGCLLAGLGPAWGRHRGTARFKFWAPALTLTALGAFGVFGLGGALTQQGGYHGVGGYLATIGRQGLFREILDPWDHGIQLFSSTLGLLVWGFGKKLGWRAPTALLGFILIPHLGLATFNDYGYRHALLPGMGMILGTAFLAPGLRASFGSYRAFAACFLVLAFGTSLLSLQEAADRYYATEEQFLGSDLGFSRDEGLAPAAIEDGSCYLITDSERLWALSRQRFAEGRDLDMMVGSHFNLMEPGEAVTHYRSHAGCVLWLYDVSQYRWDSLGARVRAAKMRYWFDWRREGTVRFADGLDAVVYRLSSAPWGVGEDQPIPETEFLLPGRAEREAESELESPP
jgi:hypothetical protein